MFKRWRRSSWGRFKGGEDEEEEEEEEEGGIGSPNSSRVTSPRSI